MTDMPGEAPSKSPRMPTGEYVLDAWNDLWLVMQARPTGHDFVIFLGRPREATGPMGAEVIVTPELMAHFEKHRRSPGAMDIPLSGTTIKRIRSLLGFNKYQDLEMWWLDRLNDLHELTTADFCARHRVWPSMVVLARHAYLNEHRLPEKDWWKKGEMRDMLLSKMPAAWIAQKVGLAGGTIRKYRAALINS